MRIELFKHYIHNGIETDYLISDSGLVYSLKNNKYVKPQKNHRGYLRVGIYINGKAYRVSIHKMVINTFGPQQKENQQVDHKDGNKENNDIDNLEWVSPSENIRRAFKLGLKSAFKGETHAASVYTDKFIDEMCKSISEGMSISEASRKFNFQRSYIYSIISGKNWAHISSKYDFTKSYTKQAFPKEFYNDLEKMMGIGMKKGDVIMELDKKYNVKSKNVVYRYGLKK